MHFLTKLLENICIYEIIVVPLHCEIINKIVRYNNKVYITNSFSAICEIIKQKKLSYKQPRKNSY